MKYSVEQHILTNITTMDAQSVWNQFQELCTTTDRNKKEKEIKKINE